MAMEAVGGTVMRRARVDVVQAEFDQDITAIKKEILQLEAVYRHAQGEAQARLQDKIDAAASHPSTIAARATLKLARLGRETAVHVRAIEVQAIKAQAKATLRRATRLAGLRKRYEKRAARLRRVA